MRWWLVAALVAACTHPTTPPPRPTPAAPDWPSPGVDWRHPPAPGPDVAAAELPVVETDLANGIRVVVVESPRVPLVSIATIHTAAGSREDGAQPGLAALTAELIHEGPRDAAFAEALEAAGTRFDVDIATDYASTHATALAEHLGDALRLVAAAVRTPRLADRDLVRLRAARLAELAARADRPRTLAALAFDRLVFGAHPYGHSPAGTRASVAAITAADARAFWERAYGPATTTIIVVGARPVAELQREVARAFGDWAVLVPPPPPPPHVGAAGPAVIGYLDRPGATEVGIVVGRPVTIAAGDRLAAEVANTIFGGGPGARLDRRLRAELHVTSGIASSVWRGQLGAAWSIVTSTRTADATRAVSELLAMIETARTVDPTPDELARAKQLLTRGVVGAGDTTAGTARALERLVVQERALTFAGYPERIATITATAARAAVDRAWEHPSVVVVGDWAAIRDDLAKLGLPIVALPEPD